MKYGTSKRHARVVEKLRSVPKSFGLGAASKLKRRVIVRVQAQRYGPAAITAVSAG